MDKIIIRIAKHEDSEKILFFLNLHSIDNSFKTCLSSRYSIKSRVSKILNNGKWYIAIVNEKIVGIIAVKKLYHKRNYPELSTFVVTPKLRGKGIGTLLMKKIIEDKDVLKHNKFILDTWEGCEAISIFEKFGFKKTKSYKDNKKRGNNLKTEYFVKELR